MSKPAKLPFPQLMRAFWSPYLRLLGYMTPYRKRFFLGIAFGVLAGIVSGSLTLVILKAGESIGVKIDKSQLMPGAMQVPRHRAAHDTQPQKCHLRHAAPALRPAHARAIASGRRMH